METARYEYLLEVHGIKSESFDNDLVSSVLPEHNAKADRLRALKLAETVEPWFFIKA
jgi:hypothetical protein